MTSPSARIGRGIAVVALVAAALPTATTVAASAAAGTAGASSAGLVGIQLLDAPVAAKDDPRAQMYVVDQLQPGQTITRHVGVDNLSAAAQPVRVYVGGATITDGAFRFTADDHPSDLTAWTTVTPATATVGVDARLTAQVTVRVPADAPGGERYGVIWAEVAAPVVPGQAREVSRVGVRMYLDVAGPTPQPTRFTVDHVVATRTADGRPEVRADVRNTGARAVDVTGTLRLADGPAGLAAGPVPPTRTVTLAPGAGAPVDFVLGAALPAGPWTATIALTSGLAHADTTARLIFPARGATPALATGGFPWPLTGGAAALVVVAAGVVVLIRQRQRHRTTAGTT